MLFHVSSHVAVPIAAFGLANTPRAYLPLVISGLAALAIFTLVLGFGREWRRRHASPLERLGSAAMVTAVAPAPRLSSEPRPTARLESELRQAGLVITTGEFLLGIILLAGIGLLISWWSHNLILGIVLLGTAAFGPRRWLRGRMAKRARDFDAQLPAMLESLASSIGSGRSMQQAIEHAAREMPAPMSVELRRMIRNIQLLNGGIEEALVTFDEEMHSKDLHLIVNALTLQLRAGGDIKQMLESINKTIRERVTLNGEVQALTAQQRFAGLVLSLMPVVLALALLIFNPKYLLGVFAVTTWCGWTMFGGAAIMIIAGMLVMQKTVAVKI